MSFLPTIPLIFKVKQFQEQASNMEAVSEGKMTGQDKEHDLPQGEPKPPTPSPSEPSFLPCGERGYLQAHG